MKEKIQATYNQYIKDRSVALTEAVLREPQGHFILISVSAPNQINTIAHHNTKMIAQVASKILGVRIVLDECFTSNGDRAIAASIDPRDLDGSDT